MRLQMANRLKQGVISRGFSLVNLHCHAALQSTNNNNGEHYARRQKKCCCLLVGKLTSHYLLYVGLGISFIRLWHSTQTSTVWYCRRWDWFGFLVRPTRSSINLYRVDL